MRALIISFLFYTAFQGNLYAQDYKTAVAILQNINSTEELDNAIKELPEISFFSGTVLEEGSTSMPEFFNSNVGDFASTRKACETCPTVLHKIIGIDSVEAFNCSYIYFFKDNHTLDQIEYLSELLIEKHSSGVAFEELKNIFNEAKTDPGYLNWVYKEYLVPEINSIVLNQEPFTIELLDVTTYSAYVLNYKLEPNRMLKAYHTIGIYLK